YYLEKRRVDNINKRAESFKAMVPLSLTLDRESTLRWTAAMQITREMMLRWSCGGQNYTCKARVAAMGIGCGGHGHCQRIVGVEAATAQARAWPGNASGEDVTGEYCGCECGAD
ncbi:hypothetical protein HN51_021273, partial [Arachis hypogaea]